jgi:hypothetical protein
MLVGPLDAVLGPGASKPFQQRADLLEVIDLERKIALAEGCAFFDLFTAMGGTGSLQRFQAKGLVHDDLVHPRGKGLDLLGALISDALLKTWSETPRAEQPEALVAAWTTLLGGAALPREVDPLRRAPSVALIPGDPKDPVAGGIQRMLAAARAWTPRSEEARWLVLDSGVAQPPRPAAKDGLATLRCASLVPASNPAREDEPCLPVTLPPLPEDLQDPMDRGGTVGAWLLAELVLQDSMLTTAESTP